MLVNYFRDDVTLPVDARGRPVPAAFLFNLPAAG